MLVIQFTYAFSHFDLFEEILFIWSDWDSLKAFLLILLILAFRLMPFSAFIYISLCILIE